MRTKYIFFLLFLLRTSAVDAQVSSLHQNFDVACVTSPSPDKWNYYNPIPSTDPMGAWHCSSSDGIGGTPGVECSGIYGLPRKYHLDTSYLLTPKLDLSGTSGPVYMQFCSKNTAVRLGAKLSLIIMADSPVSSVYIDTTKGVTPIFGNSDSTGWMQHEFNLTSFKSTPFYIAFRYTSTDTTGSVWSIDNVNINSYSILDVNGNPETHKMNIAAQGSRQGISVFCDIPEDGLYKLQMYDMLGNKVVDRSIMQKAGNSTYKIEGLDLAAGIYIIRLQAEKATGVCRIHII